MEFSEVQPRGIRGRRIIGRLGPRQAQHQVAPRRDEILPVHRRKVEWRRLHRTAPSREHPDRGGGRPFDRKVIGPRRRARGTSGQQRCRKNTHPRINFTPHWQSAIYSCVTIQ
jgi:hypothetical protein